MLTRLAALWRGAPVRSHSRRVLLAWWGAFANGGGATLGDFHAVANVARWLGEHGVQSTIINGTRADFADIATAPPDISDDGTYGCLAFVCGPLVLNRGMRKLLRTFRHMPKAAVGVSVIDGKDINGRFDRIVARDSSEATEFDLALAYESDKPLVTASRKRRLALCLRGMQKTYGAENCLSDLADDLFNEIAAAETDGHLVIDTVIHAGNEVADIERGFATASVLCTTRMHGTIFALTNRIPFVAIDQIRGGAKVARIMDRVGWPWAYRADTMNADAVK